VKFRSLAFLRHVVHKVFGGMHRLTRGQKHQNTECLWHRSYSARCVKILVAVVLIGLFKDIFSDTV